MADERLRALNRFGLGARVGEPARLADPRGWLRGQLDGDARITAGVPADSDISGAIQAYRRAGQGQDRDRQEARRRIVALAAAEQRAALTARITTERPFLERLVAFWSNHLCVSAGAKIPVAALAGSYERQVVRPHVLGRFEDMVLASAKHPAMLIYLDNLQSIGPNSRAAKMARGRQQRGLNENYARELLELHTLGVDGGYTQADVTELARLLTGWTLDGFGPRQRDGAEMRFQFVPQLHEPGAKTVVGARYNEGVGEGERAVRTLCRHPSTAKFVATKLVTHFVADAPPAAAVDRLAKVFAESGGDLKRVSLALVDLPEAWADGGTRKFRTPQDWIVATLRSFNAREIGDPMLQTLRQLRHPLWSPQAPKGFGDTRQEWADPDSLMNRAELARNVARRVGRAGVDPRALLEVMEVPPDDPLRTMLGDGTIPVDERIALAIAGPAFQWR
jgi:uncharacterized protein (DUF1800 family)